MPRMRSDDDHQDDDDNDDEHDDENDDDDDEASKPWRSFFIYVSSVPLAPTGNAEDALS